MFKKIVGRARGVGSRINLQERLSEQDHRIAANPDAIRSQEAATRILALKNASEEMAHRMGESSCKSRIC